MLLNIRDIATTTKPGWYFCSAFTSSSSRDFLCSRTSERLKIQRTLFLHLASAFAQTAKIHLSLSFYVRFNSYPHFLFACRTWGKNLLICFALLERSFLRQELNSAQNARVTISQAEAGKRGIPGRRACHSCESLLVHTTGFSGSLHHLWKHTALQTPSPESSCSSAPSRTPPALLLQTAGSTSLPEAVTTAQLVATCGSCCQGCS